VIHSSDILEIFEIFESSDSGFFEHIETSLFYKLSYDFEGNLISPSIYKRHGHIINKYSHIFVVRGCKIFTNFEITFGLNCLLEHERGGSRGEIDSLEKHFFFVKFFSVHQYG
jgi:acetyltransferase-like isoleucine patch superfamily enzyme